MTVNPNFVQLSQFGAGLIVGSLVRVALQRPLVSAAVLVATALIFMVCLNDPACREAKCALDGALSDLAGAITWWIANPAFALGFAVGFTIVSPPQKPSPA